jgi:uncharacterized protein (TIGR04255 family)
VCSDLGLSEEQPLGEQSVPLPKYRKPPVVEVAISLYFKLLGGLTTAHYGRFWALAERDYPTAEDQPPILELPLEFTALPPLRRTFFVSVDGIYVIQLQPNFFGHNWRKVRPTDQYPSFDRARELFLRSWQLFKEFLASSKFDPPELTRYEVTYVNHLVEPPGAFPAAIVKYSPLITLRATSPEHFLRSPKALLADLQFDMPDDKGALKISFKQGKRTSDQLEVMQLDLTARGPARPDGSDMLEWLELGHECIVRGFTDVTSAGAHEMWERLQ